MASPCSGVLTKDGGGVSDKVLVLMPPYIGVRARLGNPAMCCLADKLGNCIRSAKPIDFAHRIRTVTRNIVMVDFSAGNVE